MIVFDIASDIKPQIIGMSTLLTPTMTTIKDTIDAFSKFDVRQQIKITVGGTHASHDFSDHIAYRGADGLDPDANAAARLARRLVGSKT